MRKTDKIRVLLPFAFLALNFQLFAATSDAAARTFQQSATLQDQKAVALTIYNANLGLDRSRLVEFDPAPVPGLRREAEET